LMADGSGGEPAAAWVLIDDGVVARFGSALAWSVRQGASSLDVVVDDVASPVGAAGVVARRAAAFGPTVRVWSVEGTSLAPALASPPVADAGEPPADLAELLKSHGLEVIWEHGVLRGEVLGLEVARTVGSQLEVGVGRHDRSARFEMRRGETLSAALAEAAAAVRDLRRPGAPRHPANTLARSRWLRSLMVARPEAYGFDRLRPVAPPLPWFDLPDAGPAPCVGFLVDKGAEVAGVAGGVGVGGGGGVMVVVVCSVGVDLDLVPTAADCRFLYGEDSPLYLVVPENDDLPVTRSLAARLSPPALVVTVPRGWEAGPGL
jgi:hypothetical protein